MYLSTIVFVKLLKKMVTVQRIVQKDVSCWFIRSAMTWMSLEVYMEVFTRPYKSITYSCNT